MIEGLFNRPSDLSQMVMPGAVLKPLRASFLLGGWVLFCVHSVTVIISPHSKILEEDLLSGSLLVIIFTQPPGVELFWREMGRRTSLFSVLSILLFTMTLVGDCHYWNKIYSPFI